MESNLCDYDNGASRQSESSLSTFDKHKKQKQKFSMDPQSVAARHRRQKIRARFKILQSMVPGGRKMDTVSMLDETIQYVKFLQRIHIWLQARIMQGYPSCATNSKYNASFLYAQDPCNSTGFNIHSHGGLNAIPFGYNSLRNSTDQGPAISEHDWNHCGNYVRPYDPSRL